MFAGNRSGLKFHMQEGQQVVVGGTIDVFERDGRYQLYAKSITLDGAGQLYGERFEQLSGSWRSRGCLHRNINSRFLVLSGRSAL